MIFYHDIQLLYLLYILQETADRRGRRHSDPCRPRRIDAADHLHRRICHRLPREVHPGLRLHNPPRGVPAQRLAGKIGMDIPFIVYLPVMRFILLMIISFLYNFDFKINHFVRKNINSLALIDVLNDIFIKIVFPM